MDTQENTKKPKKGKNKKPITPQQKVQKKLHKDILEFFRRLGGFEYIRTEGRHITFGGQTSELDSVFLYENVIVICEETIGKNRPGDHLMKKHNFFEKIMSEKGEFIKWLKSIGSDKFGRFDNYLTAKYKIFYIYFTDKPIEESKQALYKNFNYVDARILRYFMKIASVIRHSARNEFYKFINLDFRHVGNTQENLPPYIHSAVIFPEDVSGMPEGVQIVSFVATAKELLDCAYVFRKETWEQESGYFYQRLIDNAKIKNIREFLVKDGRTFIDNVIVSLPKEVKFYDDNDDPIDLTTVSSITTNANIKIPYKINSIGIIDGQHRIYGHYEGPADTKDEQVIAKLRKKRHLFITGLYYQKGKFNELAKRKFESKLFLEINSRQKKVSSQILQHIESLQDPFSPIGLSTGVIRKMNNRSPFLTLFLLSELDINKGIKTPSIIKYGLQQLVEIDDSKETLFKHWNNPNKISLKDGNDEELYKSYISYCADTICQFFTAVKNKFPQDWVIDGTSKLLTVTTIVGFLRSFAHALEKYKGFKEIKFYENKLSSLSINFKSDQAFYVSSQWNKLAEEINKSWT